MWTSTRFDYIHMRKSLYYRVIHALFSSLYQCYDNVTRNVSLGGWRCWSFDKLKREMRITRRRRRCRRNVKLLKFVYTSYIHVVINFTNTFPMVSCLVSCVLCVVSLFVLSFCLSISFAWLITDCLRNALSRRFFLSLDFLFIHNLVVANTFIYTRFQLILTQILS